MKNVCTEWNRSPAVVQFAENVPWIVWEYCLGDIAGITPFLSALKQMADFETLNAW